MADAEPPYTAEDLEVWAWYQLDAVQVWAAMSAGSSDVEECAIAFLKQTNLLRDNAWGRVTYQTYNQQKDALGSGTRCASRDPNDRRASNRRRCSSVELHPGRHGMHDLRTQETHTWPR